MAAQNHNTTHATPKGAPLPKFRPGFATSNFYSQHVTSRNRRKPRRISYIKFSTRNINDHSESFTLTTLGDGHAVPSIFVVTPAASTKVEKLMDTLCDPFRIAILSGASRAKDLSALAHPRESAFLLDTRVEIKSNLIATESATSPKTSRYTFDRFGNAKRRLSVALLARQLKYPNHNSE